MTEKLKQKWLRLYAVAQQIGVMQPWEDFSESDRFTYIWKDKSKSVFFSFIGESAQKCGIACYVGEEDYIRANEIMNYVFKDNLAVNNTIEAVMGKAATTLLNIVDDFANTLSNKVEEMNFDLENLDMGQLQSILELLKVEK